MVVPKYVRVFAVFGDLNHGWSWWPILYIPCTIFRIAIIGTNAVNAVAKRLSVFCIFCQFARLNYKLWFILLFVNHDLVIHRDNIIKASSHCKCNVKH